MNHSHSFAAAERTFDAPVGAVSYTTRFVADGSRPVRVVYHDHDGDWQFLCGTTTQTEDAEIACLGCMLELDPSLFLLADLPAGWRAYRALPGGAWTLEPYVDIECGGPAGAG